MAKSGDSGAGAPKTDSSTLELHIEMLKLASLITLPMRANVSQPHDLFVDDIKLMVCLADTGQMTGREISNLLALNPMATSRSIERLEARGWLVRHQDDSDKRKRPVSLSAEGVDAYRHILPAIGDVADMLYSELKPAEQATLFRLIHKVLASPAFKA